MLDVRPGGIEVAVVGNDFPGPAAQFKKNSLTGTALMRRQDIRHPRQFFEDRLEAIPAPRPGVRLIRAKHARPLLITHCGSAAIGQKIDQDVLGWYLKRVIMGLTEDRFTLVERREPNGLDHFDFEWFNDCLHGLCSQQEDEEEGEAKVRIATLRHGRYALRRPP